MATTRDLSNFKMHRLVFIIVSLVPIISANPQCSTYCSSTTYTVTDTSLCKCEKGVGSAGGPSNINNINVIVGGGHGIPWGTHGGLHGPVIPHNPSGHQSMKPVIPDNYECPEERPNRPCLSWVARRNSAPQECTTDEECCKPDGIIMKCCYDACLQHKTCKPPLIKNKHA